MNTDLIHRTRPGRKRWRFALDWVLAWGAFASAYLVAGPLSGGGFTLVGTPVGGGTSTGGEYLITGGAASAGAGVSTGAEFVLIAGLFGVPVAPTEDVMLRVEYREGNPVRLWWAPEITGYRLEFTSMLGPDVNWQAVTPVPTSNEFMAPVDQPARYFRLRQP